jgi:DNA-binding GntR family transcriptional regulator
MGFNVAKSDNMTKDDVINSAMSGINEGEKLPAKSTLIDTTSRKQKALYETAMKELVSTGKIELKTGRGYFATAQQYDMDFGDY